MKIFKHLIGIISLAVWSQSICGKELPPSFEAVYQIEKAGLVLGEVVVSLTYENNAYRYQKLTKTSGLVSLFRKDRISELSTGSVDGNELSVASYQYRHEKRKNTRETTIQFSSNGKVSGEGKHGSFDLDVPQNTMDRASVELALMRDAGKQSLTYPVVQHGKLQNYKFRYNGVKKVSAPAGDFECKEYEVERNGGNRSTTLCLAENLYRLPVKAIHNEKGTELEMLLVRYQQPKAEDGSYYVGQGAGMISQAD